MPPKTTNPLPLQQQIDALIERCNLSRMTIEGAETDSHIDVDAIVRSKEKAVQSIQEKPKVHTNLAKEAEYRARAESASPSVAMDFSRFVMTSVTAPIFSAASVFRLPQRTSPQKRNMQPGTPSLGNSAQHKKTIHVAHASTRPQTLPSVFAQTALSATTTTLKTRAPFVEGPHIHHSLLRTEISTRTHIDPVSLWTLANFKRFVVVWVILTSLASAMTLLVS